LQFQNTRGWNLIILQHSNGYSSIYHVIQTVSMSVRDILCYVIRFREHLLCINMHNLCCVKNIWIPDTDNETSKIKFPLIVTHYTLLEMSIRVWGREFTYRTKFGAIHIHFLGVQMMLLHLWYKKGSQLCKLYVKQLR